MGVAVTVSGAPPVAGASPLPASSSAAGAYLFRDQMKDRYATGPTLLVQSFTGGILQKKGFTDSYAPDPLTGPGAVTATDLAVDVGNMAWVGQALLQLYARTGTPAYLTGASALAQWIQSNTFDTGGSGGYTGGLPARGAKIQ
jgi:hypothetical protein